MLERIALAGRENLPLRTRWRVVLHLSNYVLWLLLSVDSFVEDFDDSYRWQLARCLVELQFGWIIESVF